MAAFDSYSISAQTTPKILIVDDQLIMRDLLKTILRALNIEKADGIGDGEQAVELYRKRRHDMVFMDIDMPGWNGFSALSQLRVIDPRAFVVMVSAHNSVVNVKKALELGAQGFIVKPYNTSNIDQMIRKFRTSAGFLA